MSINQSTPWHKASFDRLMQDRLPQLLAKRLPLAGYHVESNGHYTCRIEITLASTSSDIPLTYADIPQPDDNGCFEIKGEPHVVVPTASHENLDTATFRCVGEQLYEYIEARLAQAPSDLPWDAALGRAWLPLDAWIDQFMRETSQRLDASNWLSRHTHLRRMIVLNHEKVIAPGQAGRVCPFEMPEGPNLGRVFTIAVGAEIRDEKLVVVDERPEATLGLSASMIPFLEHDYPTHLLMGANMLRQALAPPDPEPALVQTGNEPDAPDFWCGRDLLTAFVSWGADTCWDGIVISESCARRLNYPYPAEPGDKLGNRHGTKSVVSRVLPDDEMPHLPDGTPVELVFSFAGLHMAMNIGQLREAVMGRIARVEGHPIVVPPFGAPNQDELRGRLAQAGLPESGTETLTLGRNGPRLERPSTVGWVYWNRLVHLAKGKIRASVSQDGQNHGELESKVLRDLGAYENLRECLNTRAARREDAATLAARVAGGLVEQAGPPTPMFADLAHRLRVAGIEAALEAGKLTFRFQPPKGDVLKLACPVSHPWLRERSLTEIGAYTTQMDANDTRDWDLYTPPWHLAPARLLEEYKLLVEANDRLARMLAGHAPESLTQNAIAQLQARVNAFFDGLLRPDHLRFQERLSFSARAVIAPGANLRLDQVGLADEIAWALFGPLVIRETSDEAASRAQRARATQVLDEVMARSWVIVSREPTLTPTALLAFHPMRDPASVIRLHPLVCNWLNADFDGDQVTVFLPITEGAQCEAGECLSVASHLARDPKLVESLLPPPEALWGLASLSLTEDGRREIVQIVGVEKATPNGVLTQATLANALRQVLKQDGVSQIVDALERLTQRGLEVTKASGASMSPFIGASLKHPPMPAGNAPEQWDAYIEELAEQILSNTNYKSDDLGPQLLAVSIQSRGRRHLPKLIGPRGAVTDIHGKPLIVHHSLIEGLTPEELYACAVSARHEVAQWWTEWQELGQDRRDREPAKFTVLVRARRARHPGIVFARAAAIGEVDPLTDVDSRLLVGLPVASIAAN